jgi:carbamoyl-phosphate synthase large subunit
MKKINIAITGTGSLIGQAIIKSIKSSDMADKVKLIGCDYFRNTVGSFWCDENYILPDILKKENEKQWQKDIFEIIKKEHISILFVGVDFELSLFSKLKYEIERATGCNIIISNEKSLKISNDKYLTYEFLKKNQLNYPKTYLPSEINDMEIDYPCILKPRIGARSKNVFVINDKDDLLKKITLVDNPIIQELIGDNENEYTCGVLCLDGKIINSIALRRYLKEGNTHIAEYKKDFNPKIYTYIEKIALKLNLYGGCNFQLRLGENQEPYLFEINPRFSGTTYMRSLFGFNEVEYVIKTFSGHELKPFKLNEGKVYRYYEEKLLEI